MIYNFRHYFNFLGLPEIGKIEISEPFGFDGSSHKIMQDDGRFGRDVVIGDEEIELTITRDHFELLYNPQTLPDGVIFNHASQGFDYVASEIKNKGWEAEIEYIIEKDGVSFTTGIVDAFTAKVLEDEITFKVIQNTKREEIKRREEIYVNAFSDKDLDDNPITPCSTHRILLKAKPIYQVSTWNYSGVQGRFSGNDFVTFNSDPLGDLLMQTQLNQGANNINAVANSGIDNTISYIFAQNTVIGDPLFPSDPFNFKFLEAAERLTDVNLIMSGVTATVTQDIEENGTGVVNDGSGFLELVAVVGYPSKPVSTYRKYVLHREDFGFTPSTPTITMPTDYFLNIPVIEKGQCLWIYWAPYAEADITFDPNSLADIQTGYFIFGEISSGNIEINAVSTAISSVVEGVRLIDLMKHNVNSVGGVPLNASDYDSGGEHYDNFALNGYLLGGVTDKPFNNRFKDITDIPSEIAQDYQINPDSVEIGDMHHFYSDNEIGAFLELPDEENNSIFNKRFFLREFWLGYNKSSEGRQVNGKNTIDDVHTDSQWMPQSKKTDGNLKININHSRSAYLIEEQRKRINSSEKTESLQNDDTLFILDCVPLVPGQRLELSAHLNYSTNDLDQQLFLTDGSFKWTTLGFSVGDTLIITDTFGTRSYLVVGIGESVLTASGIAFTPAGEGDDVFTINYPITNVNYTNRTNEGFDLIEGVFLPDNYSNLNYSLKRNIQRWYPYLATCVKYISGKLIKNTLFKINSELVTRKTGELANVVDKADIVVNDIAEQKILDPIIHKVNVFADFEQATQFFKDVRDIKGFARVQLNTNEVVKGYVKEADYEYSTGKLSLQLEKKYETDFLMITKTGSDIFINGINYTDISFEVNNNFVSLYDSDMILINTATDFRFIEINGVRYTDVVLFSDALTLLLTL